MRFFCPTKKFLIFHQQFQNILYLISKCLIYILTICYFYSSWYSETKKYIKFWHRIDPNIFLYSEINLMVAIFWLRPLCDDNLKYEGKFQYLRTASRVFLFQGSKHLYFLVASSYHALWTFNVASAALIVFSFQDCVIPSKRCWCFKNIFRISFVWILNSTTSKKAYSFYKML